MRWSLIKTLSIGSDQTMTDWVSLYPSIVSTNPFPYQGDTFAAVFNDVLRKTPIPLVRLNPDLPDDPARIINKSLKRIPRSVPSRRKN